MKILNIKLFFTLLVGLCLYHSVQAQRMVVEGDNAMTVLKHLLSDDPEHENRNYLDIKVDPTTGKPVIIDESGLLVLGTEDVCLRHHEDVYLSVKGVAIKTDDPLWASPADSSYKINIMSLDTTAINKFMNTIFYSYKSEESAPLRYGVLTQQVEGHFPHSVDYFTDGTEIHHTFNPNNLFYSGMKVIQENRQQLTEQAAQLQDLQTQLQAKQAENDQLAAEVEAIKTALANAGIDIPVTPTSELESRSGAPDDSNLKSTAPKLKQNIPNPFQQSTSIPYYLPSNTQQAVLVIHDMTGKTVLQQTLPNQEGEGKVEIDLSNSELRGGVYVYSLYVNKQLIDTKKLSLLTK